MIQAAGMTRARISWGFPQTRRSTVARRFPFDLYIPAENAEYEGLIKVQGIARLGSGWSWTQNDVIPELGSGDFTREVEIDGKLYRKALCHFPW